MEDEEFFKRQLNAALAGGNSDGRLLLRNIATLLSNGYDEGLKHGLLPKEYVKYLADVLLRICDSPTEATKILKISNPPNRNTHTNVLYDGAITYLCAKTCEEMGFDLTEIPDAVFRNVAVEISDDYKEFIKKRSNTKKDSISEATVRRRFKRAYPFVRKFKNIEGYKWLLKFLNNETIRAEPNGITLSEIDTIKNLYDEISDCQHALNVLNIVPKNDDILKKELTNAAQEMIDNDDKE